MKSFCLLLLGLLLLKGSEINAQTACPPGMTPYGVGVCGYDNSQRQEQPVQQRPPLPQWEDHWGAIATYEPNGSLGVATNMPSQSSAEQAALVDCQSKHGSTCKIQLSYRNQCAAMVVSDKGYNVTPAATVDLAVTEGMATCTKSGDPNCHVYYSACSLPVRTQ